MFRCNLYRPTLINCLSKIPQNLPSLAKADAPIYSLLYFVSVQYNHHESAEFLLNERDVHPVIGSSVHSLSIALENRDEKMTEIISQNSKTDLTIENHKFIKEAARLGWKRSVEFGINHPDVDIGVTNGYPLFAAIANNHYDIVKMLTRPELLHKYDSMDVMKQYARGMGRHKILQLLTNL